MHQCYDALMRTTLEIGDDVLVVARSLAGERKISLGAAVSELARRGLQSGRSQTEGDLPVFEVPPDAGAITPEMVDAALDE